jgi:tetratricopeptide (TPR) repeat protein/predicted Ser/Thr protein kinase
VDPADPAPPDASAETAPTADRGDDAQLVAVLAEARPAESPALLLARARVGGALFGAAIGLGRFRVLERLGGGGMGVVYAAYDPQLDRGVALKTLHVPHAERELALREAKALARLAHPNIVPVFDVGIEGEHVYIVMELVRGETLREWVKGRTPREILGVYRQAGQALAAAHSAGLVHRDFKPENAIVGTDGRVRVIDFGLACEAATDPAAGGTRRVAGTPRYMSPEQVAGAAVTPAADQYSFSVSLDEALRGDPPRPVPRWIDLVIERGTAVAPATRFGSMTALLRALGRDPARIWRQRFAVMAVVAGVSMAFVIGRASLLAPDEACSGGAQAIASAWEPRAQQSALARISALSPYGREIATRIAPRLGEYSVRWADDHRDACLAHRRGEQSEALLDHRMACLDRGRAALHALAEIATAAGEPRAVPGVARAASELPDPDACADVRALTSNVEPPPPAQTGPIAAADEQIARARVQLAAGNADIARNVATAAVTAARTIAYRPLLAEALLMEGHALMATGDRLVAIAPLTEATTLGLSSGSEPIAIEAWARRAWLEGTSAHPEAALDGLATIDALASQPSPAFAFARALLHNNVGSVELGRRGHRAVALAMLERALDDARSVTGPGTVELVSIRTNTAIATDDPVRRDALLDDAHAELARLLGDHHPDTLDVQFIRATTTISFARAAEMLEPVCRQRELHTWLAPYPAICWVDLADLRAELGDRAAAVTALDRAIALGADSDANTPEAVGYRQLWGNDASAAVRHFSAMLDKIPERPDEPWYRTETRARLLLGLGRALAALHRRTTAAEMLERSIAIFEPLARDQRAIVIARRLGRARTELARVRAAMGVPPETTRAIAAAALAWLVSAGGPANEITELQYLAAPSR